MVNLAGENVSLRALEPYDADFVYNCENNTTNWYVSNTIAPMSKHTIQEFINNQSDIYNSKQLRLIIETLSSNKPVGLIDLFKFDPFNLRAEVGILIENKQHKQKGYATEALNLIIDYSAIYLGIHQLYCNINISNEISKKLFLNANFQTIGVKKQWLKTFNGWEDVLILQKILK